MKIELSVSVRLHADDGGLIGEGALSGHAQVPNELSANTFAGAFSSTVSQAILSNTPLDSPGVLAYIRTMQQMCERGINLAAAAAKQMEGKGDA